MWLWASVLMLQSCNVIWRAAQQTVCLTQNKSFWSILQHLTPNPNQQDWELIYQNDPLKTFYLHFTFHVSPVQGVFYHHYHEKKMENLCFRLTGFKQNMTWTSQNKFVWLKRLVSGFSAPFVPQQIFCFLYLLLGHERGALTVHGVVGEVVRKRFGSIPRWITRDAFRDLWKSEHTVRCCISLDYRLCDRLKKHLQVDDGGFGSFHLDDAFCIQVLLPAADQ